MTIAVNRPASNARISANLLQPFDCLIQPSSYSGVAKKSQNVQFVGSIQRFQQCPIMATSFSAKLVLLLRLTNDSLRRLRALARLHPNLITD
jgi:hypothetical protein